MDVNKDESRAPVSFDQLVAGYEFPTTSYELNAPLISKYLEAVGGQPSPAAEFVPPLAIAAYIMTAMSQSLTLPAGSIHAAQDVEFFKLVPIGATVECRAKVAQKLQRGKLNLLILELEALNQDREKVLSGKATLVLPG
ncbi:MaoC family dehydratase [Chloroflexota bacterium]